MANKGLLPKIHKQLIQLYSLKKKMIKNGQKTLIDIFSKEDTQKSKVHEKMCKLLIIKEMQIKTTIRDHHLTPVKMPIIKKSMNNKYWQGCEEKGTPAECW